MTTEAPTDPRQQWWWTPTNGGRCSNCRERTPKGSLIAYNHAERSALCEVCVDQQGLAPERSKRAR